MEFRDVLRIFFAILSLYFYSVAFIDLKKLKKAIEQEELEILKDKFIKTTSRIMWLTITGSIFGLVAILLFHSII